MREEHHRSTATQKHHTGRMKQECKKLKEIIQKLEGEFDDLKDEAEKSQAKKDLFEDRRDELANEVNKGEEEYANEFQRLRDLEQAIRNCEHEKALVEDEMNRIVRTGR